MSVSDQQSVKIKRLNAWFHHVGIEHESVSLFYDSEIYGDNALGIKAAKDIEEGAVLATIPKSSVISPKTSLVGPFLEDNKIGGGLGLVFAVMYEAAKGSESKWYDYLSLLPARENVPMFWAREEEALLQGTDAACKPEEDRADTAADYEEEIVPLLEGAEGMFDKSKMTLEAFRAAASWVGSRAFGVDDHHGMGMVPFADMFNHKASIIKLSDDYELEGACLEVMESASEIEAEDSDRLEEGSDEGDSNYSHDIASSSSEFKLVNELDLRCPTAQNFFVQTGVDDDNDEQSEDRPIVAHATRGSMLDASAFPDQDLRPHICIVGAERDGKQVLEIIAACPLAEGQEIFNTFGELENTDLVCKYGFALPDNPFNAVHLSKSVLLEEAEGIMGKKQLKRRRQYLEHQSHLLEDGEEPFSVLPVGKVGPSLVVAARILTCNQADFTAIEHSDLTDALEKLLHRNQETSEEEPGPMSNTCKRQKTFTEGNGTAKMEDINEDINLREDVAAGTSTEAGQPGIDGEDISQLADIKIAPKAAWFPDSVCKLLRSCLERRMRSYLHDDIQKDKDALQDAKCKRPRLEKHRARMAALTLVISEKELLLEALQALDD